LISSKRTIVLPFCLLYYKARGISRGHFLGVFEADRNNFLYTMPLVSL
jgi:hypothetical protein